MMFEGILGFFFFRDEEVLRAFLLFTYEQITIKLYYIYWKGYHIKVDIMLLTSVHVPCGQVWKRIGCSRAD